MIQSHPMNQIRHEFERLPGPPEIIDSPTKPQCYIGPCVRVFEQKLLDIHLVAPINRLGNLICWVTARNALFLFQL